MIKYDEPRTWWLTDLQDDCPVPFSVIAESDTHLFFPSGIRDAKKGSYWEYFETKEQAESVIAERLACEKATTDAEARIKSALAACENMPTESLTPGCVAKMVEALERIRDAQTINPGGDHYMTEGDMQELATAALAAMKGA